jgi:hypothetical protein
MKDLILKIQMKKTDVVAEKVSEYNKKENKMAEEQKEGAKGAFIEKLLFAILPLLLGSVGYLINALGSIQHDVTILNQKVSLVVTTDNKQASNSGAELAREKLRQDLEKEIQKNRDAIMENRQHIAILEDRASMKKIGPMKDH